MKVQILQKTEEKKWDDFVVSHPDSTFFHLASWRKIIEQVFGHSAYYLYAEDSLGIQAILPLGHVKSKIFGNALISIPFYVYGGVLAKNDNAHKVIVDRATLLAQELNVDFLELRNVQRTQPTWPVKNDLYVRFRKEIDPNVEQNLNNIPRKQRAMVRKGQAAGLTASFDDDLDGFYDSYAISLHSLGTPIFSKKLVYSLKDFFGDSCRILSVRKEGKLVASVLSFYYRDEVLPYYAGTSDDAREYKAHDFMYWELMKAACEQGLKWFDYGRSKVDTGSYSFKKNWGFEPEPLNYEYFLVNQKELPNISPTNPKYGRFINTWRRLPLWATKMIGPHIVRNIG